MNITISEKPIDLLTMRNKNTLRIFFTILNSTTRGSEYTFRVIRKLNNNGKIVGQFTCYENSDETLKRTFEKAVDRYKLVLDELEKDDINEEIICYAPVSYKPLYEAHMAKQAEKFTPSDSSGEQIIVAPEFIHLRKFKANIRNMIKIKGLDYAENMHKEFEAVLQEERESLEERLKVEAEKVEKRAKALKYLEEEGLSIEDLLHATNNKVNV